MKTRLYNIWHNMRTRCYNPNYTYYNRYGGRGIAICEEWNKYETFKKWALENGYSDNLTLDRKDNNKNYDPSNCRWVSRKTQANNRNNGLIIEFEGKRKTCAEWSEETGISYKTLENRIRHGWPSEKILTTPVDKKYRTPMIINFFGEEISVAEAARRLGFEESTLRNRILRGWTVEKAITTPLRNRN